MVMNFALMLIKTEPKKKKKLLNKNEFSTYFLIFSLKIALQNGTILAK